MVSAATSGAGADRNSFVGREREIAELCRLAAGSRLLTLCGAVGIGKSRLLAALTAALAPGYPDGTFSCPLADLGQPGLLTLRVALTLGICEEPGIELAETLAQALRGRRMVLALDGYEHQAGPCATLCERLLADSPGLLLLAAGREPLGVPGETVWAVPALGLPPADEEDPEGADRADAVALFARRAAVAAPGFTLGAENRAAVAAACRAAGGVPLAIELAAARAGELDAAEIAAGLGGRLGRTEDAACPPPAAAMTAAIGWSHDRLTLAEQVMLRRLAVSPSWTLEMAEQICADDAGPLSQPVAGAEEEPPRLLAAECLGPLVSLTRLGMIEEGGSPGHSRWRIPRPIGDDAARRLALAGEDGLLGRRLRDYAAQRTAYIVTIAHARVPVTQAALNALFRDYNTDARNLRAALAWCLEHGDVAGGLRMCTQFGIYWNGAATQAEGAWWFSKFGTFLDGEDLPASLRGPALAVRAMLAFHRGDLAGARAWAAGGAELCQAARDMPYATMALTVLGQTAIAAGHPEEALRLTAEALELARPVWDSWGRLFALNVRAEALTVVGRLDEARESAAAALELALESSHYFGATGARRGLAEAALAAGDLELARDSYLAALPYMRAVMPAPVAARCLADLSAIALRLGDQAQGRGYLAESLMLAARAGSRAGVAAALLAFAGLAVADGGAARAVQLAGAATGLCAAAGQPAPARAKQFRDAAGLAASEAERLWSDGLAMTSHAAAQLALSPL